jgi:hypothetical protein
MIQGRSRQNSRKCNLRKRKTFAKKYWLLKALNAHGGGSSCFLVNGHETIKPSEKEGESPVPAVFIIKEGNGYSLKSKINFLLNFNLA